MDIKGKHPNEILNSTVTAEVIHCIGHEELDGLPIDFPYKAIEWNTHGIIPDGIYITYLNYGYTFVKYETMKIK